MLNKTEQAVVRAQIEALQAAIDALTDLLPAETKAEFAGYTTSGKLKVKAKPKQKPGWNDPAKRPAKPGGRRLTTGG